MLAKETPSLLTLAMAKPRIAASALKAIRRNASQKQRDW